MEYRIKMILKNNGGKEFIPQYRSDDWDFKIFCGVILFPVLLFFEFIFHKAGVKVLSYFFIHWNDIEHDIPTPVNRGNSYFFKNKLTACFNKAEAEEIIKHHKEAYEAEKERALQEDVKKKGDQTRKIVYIKIK